MPCPCDSPQRLHALVLSGEAPDLAACYPPFHIGSATRLWPAMNEVLVRHDEMIRIFLTSPPQTNEVGRSGVLLGGFLTVAASTGLPLRILEIGDHVDLRPAIGPGRNRDRDRAAGRRAADAAPLAWLRFEPSGTPSGAELTLTTWPGEQHRRLATATAHGHRITWL